MASGSWTPASGCDNQKERKGEKRGEKATVSTHPKYSQARSYTTYALVSNEIRLLYVDWTAESRNKRGIASPFEDYASGSLRLATCRRE